MNKRYKWTVVFTALCFLVYKPILATTAVSPQQGDTVVDKWWAYEMLNVIRQKANDGVVVKVAVVDDGFSLSHNVLKDFLYTNTQEIPDNFQDDDQNGYLDDVCGYDVSDTDNNVSPPKGKEETYFHGTYIAGVIIKLFQQCYGDEASRHLKIIPVKVLSDKAQNTWLADGYKGIRYACNMGADIICCAWSGGSLTEDDRALISQAIAKGTIIVGAAGNFFSEKNETPSSLPGVVCVAGLDSTLKKSPQSNYGMRVDISAPGVSVYGPFPSADNAYVFEKGTSPATALITGCLAILKVLKPEASTDELMDALCCTAVSVDNQNLTYCGKLGAGMPDMAKAIAFIMNPGYKYVHHNAALPEGSVFYKRKMSGSVWNITPSGAYNGMHLYASSAGYQGQVNIYNHDSLFYSGAISSLSRGTYIPGIRFRIEVKDKPKASKEMSFRYYMQTIDSTTLYCDDLVELNDSSGIITDNSGSENYANNCSCKWQISAPVGKRIRIVFDQMDTQANVDFVWIFDGEATLQERLMAKFSGNNIPPVITSFTNKVLIWFVTDASRTGQGWKMSYQVED